MAGKKTKAKRSKKRAKGKPAKAAARPIASPTVVQLRFENPTHARRTNMAKKKLHGAAAAAHARAAKKHKHNPATPKSHGAKHRRRRNPRITFVSALGKVAGGAAAMFGSGVVTTLASVKLSSAMATPTAPAAAAWAYVPSLVVALIGAGVATRSPLVGAGIAAGGAAPFILPVAARILTPAPASTAAGAAGNATVSALRAVSMGSGWRALGAYPRSMASVNMGAVSMGRAYAT